MCLIRQRRWIQEVLHEYLNSCNKLCDLSQPVMLELLYLKKLKAGPTEMAQEVKCTCRRPRFDVQYPTPEASTDAKYVHGVQAKHPR